MDRPLSHHTRNNWVIDALVFGSALIAALTGIYFLFWPSGRTSVTLLFTRDTWSDLHTWGGIAMILAAAIHIARHWNWVSMTAKKVAKMAHADGGCISRGAKINILIDLVIAICFLLTAVSGLYFWLAPSSGYQGGRNPAWNAGFLVSRTTWDMIHTWAGVALIIAAQLHFAIHWRWIKNVTVKTIRSLVVQPIAQTTR